MMISQRVIRRYLHLYQHHRQHQKIRIRRDKLQKQAVPVQIVLHYPEEVDIKEEDFSDTEEKPAKRLKTEPQDLSVDSHYPFEPSDLNYYPEVKEEPLDIKVW
ncbi:unnamed protein product [Callosobruchus maculatus]|uniref:Uncharacterized protein n=1 Tax=Callosobruchus maculatus TaxID=64391 RepID=A0A653CK05_CALMS|nr:unnamed protein product [Callosobruchus maculatus]